MRIGVDFDNTIANYDGVFYQVAFELGWIPQNVGHSKEAVKQFFILQNNEPKWTELQGLVYGRKIKTASVYEGFKETLKDWIEAGHWVAIISHKTQYPVIGEKVSLHDCAFDWLLSNGLVGDNPHQISPQQVYFNERKEQKVEKIKELACDVFVDDLMSIFNHPAFPEVTQKILFDPHLSLKPEGFSGCYVSHWNQVRNLELS